MRLRRRFGAGASRPWRFPMAFVITEPCKAAKNAACVAVCPCDCIHPTPDEAGFVQAEQLFIDPDPCIDCGLCAGECPVKAIFLDEDVPPEWRHYIELNAAHYRRK